MPLETLEYLQKEVFKEYSKNGYILSWSILENQYTELQAKLDIAELGLITTEIAEAMEEIRNKEKNDRETQLDRLGLECADIIIRTLNFMSRNAINATYYINKKIEINNKRTKLHDRFV